MTQKDLKDGKKFVWKNRSSCHILEVEFQEPAPLTNWTSPFQAWFNGQLFGFKTFKELESKVNKLITKFNLK